MLSPSYFLLHPFSPISSFNLSSPSAIFRASELVAQDPNDEPASVLLERIRNAKCGTARKQSVQLRRSAANQAT